MKKNSYETIVYSVGGVAILLGILIAFNALTATVKQRVDLTQDKAYTLSAGTRAILKKLDGKVKIRFYYSSKEEIPSELIGLKTYAQHVKDLLDEYKQAAGGKIVLEQYDPEPDSDAEDSARLDGVEGQMLPAGERFYLGLAVSQLDAKEAIPFLTPDRERMLEYDLSRAISVVANPEKPVVGIMSPLPVFGSPANPMMMRMGQGQGQEPWAIVSELKSEYNVKTVDMTTDKIDDSIKVLVVIHPREITDQAQYAIDQFVMRGGKLIAFLDATSLVDTRNENPMMGAMPGAGSSLDKLLKAWGIQFENTKVAADLNYKMQLMGRNNQPTEAPAFLRVSDDGINKNDIATSEIKDLWIPLGGVFTGTPATGLKETVLLKTTKDSQLVDGMMAAMGGENIINEFKPSGTEYALAIRLTGNFKTAFPDGKPKETKEEKKDEPKPTEEPKSGDSLKETKSDNAVVLFGDADMLYDQFTIRRQNFLGMVMQEPMNGNLTLAQNLVEQMSGDSNLISVRSRASAGRPFTRIQAMEAKADEAYQSKIKEFQDSQRETQEKINQLQQSKQQGQQRFILSPEQQAELDKLKKKAAETNVQLRQEKKRLARDKESLQNTLKWVNILAMPAAVAISGICLAAYKRKRTSAK
jgi:ABC-type uncharacterized transport system involved in gliding motility auxiliary subunit